MQVRPALLWALSFASSVSAHPCGTCHSREVQAYANTGMANALSKSATQPVGELFHIPSGTRFSVTREKDGMHQQITRQGVSGDYRVVYSVGSGRHASGYVVQIGPYLFQSPISYQTDKNKWIMAPGYEEANTPDFDRPVGFECLLCHSGKPNIVRGTRNRYQDPPIAEPGISCDRCHGPVEQHVARPSRENIVNPGRLSPGARDSVCEQCHLQGEARILNPGKDWDDFKPGELLESTFTVFIADAGNDAPLRVISQSQQLRRSKCWKSSADRLWCGTCHDPHRTPENKAAYYREKCLACHGSTLANTHQAPGRDCIACHMPSRGTVDGAHVAFTDHQIRLRPAQEEAAGKPVALTPWRSAPIDYETRNLGLAYLNAGTQHQSPELLKKAFPLLAEARKSFPRDPELTAGLGIYADLNGMYRKAAEIFELAIEMKPTDLTSYQAAAAAWMEAGDPTKAKQHLEAAIRTDPSDETSYVLLADLCRQLNEPAEQSRVVDSYLKFRPQSVEFQRRKRTGLATLPP